jgi:hypothetical protein
MYHFTGIDDREFSEDIESLVADVNRRLSGVDALKDGFSDKFLFEAIELARENLEKNPDDSMWLAIANHFDAIPDGEQVNKALLREILGLPSEGPLVRQQIEAPEAIKTLVRDRWESVERVLDSMTRREPGLKLKGYLNCLAELEKLHGYLNEVKEAIRVFLTEKTSGIEMMEQLRRKLIDAGAHQEIVEAYLDEQIVDRVLYHAELLYDLPGLSMSIDDRIAAYRKAASWEIASNYGFVHMDTTGDSFALSCKKLQSVPQINWRDQIAFKLSMMSQENEKYRALIAERIKTDKKLAGFSLKQYCEWICQPTSPVGRPELEAFSQISGCPVLVVQNFVWKDGINLNFDKDPLVFLVDEDGVWRALSPLRSA